MNLTLSRVPSATYRLQFNADFRLEDARRLVGYLADMGITDAYASPLFRAREGSSHGYDVVDHEVIDPEIGTQADFQSLAEELRVRGLGLMLDVVPNHMGIDDCHNRWWQDVLENGESSPYATYFDIDWDPPKEALKGKVLLPFLGDQYGKALENQDLKLIYDGERFLVTYYDRRFPIEPRSSLSILGLVADRVKESLDAASPQRMELESVMTALENLPPRTERDLDRIQLRHRESEVIRRRLATLYAACVPIHEAMDKVIVELNGRAGDPHSFDRLEALLAEQAYRLSSWRVAADEINYRRFFDINALAAIRVEDPEVFRAVHAKVRHFLEQGWVQELRIDHPDGLWDPRAYFDNLQSLHREANPETAAGESGAAEPSVYVAVEKILMSDEALPSDWPVCGTTGYEFLNLLNGLFVDRRGAYALGATYVRFTGQATSFADVLYEGKRSILSYSMSSELYVLAGELDRISEQHRWSRDFTRSSLHRALREVIACFPVYRTYIRPDDTQVSPEDRRRILAAVRSARRRNPAMSAPFFDFIASVLLLEHPDGLTDQQRRERVRFVLKFQQITGPVMAKGMEDTAFYRWYPLASLNEVGGDPALPGTALEEFHRRNADRLAAWPYSMLATATHDTKRGEDVRARLNVLSEVAEAWDAAIHRWQSCNAAFRVDIDGQLAPDPNEEYLLYQTLVGTWPVERATSTGVGSHFASSKMTPDPFDPAYVDRILAYMEKALKEAKLHTSWVNPDQQYDQAVADFVRAVLDPGRSPDFLKDVDRFARSITDAGWLNSLSQSVLKICSPGVPDFYQGTELWDFHLVDPDNRRPVDFQRRRELLGELQARAREGPPGLAAELICAWPDERLKMFVIWRALSLRREHPAVFLQGSYTPLPSEGPRAENVCAFAREHDGRWVLAVAPRLCSVGFQPANSSVSFQPAAPARETPAPQFAADWWEGTSLRLPPTAPCRWRNAFTDAMLSSGGDTMFGGLLQLSEVFRIFPVAILDGMESNS